jgi:hypothetical protein
MKHFKVIVYLSLIILLKSCQHQKPINSASLVIDYSCLKSDNAIVISYDNGIISEFSKPKPYQHPLFEEIKNYADKVNTKSKTLLNCPEEGCTTIKLWTTDRLGPSTLPCYLIEGTNLTIYLDAPLLSLSTTYEERTKFFERVELLLKPLAKKVDGTLKENNL